MSNKSATKFATQIADIGVIYCNIWGFLVRVIGLEPTRPKAPEPKSGASTNFATPAHEIRYSTIMKIKIKETNFIIF